MNGERGTNDEVTNFHATERCNFFRLTGPALRDIRRRPSREKVARIK